MEKKIRKALETFSYLSLLLILGCFVVSGAMLLVL